ncbi:hypothetical protein JOQ06_004111 [Pogonophryne albipinna]|uniref:B30.2/SPRY domain-containing protein n=1 Tax=Pogonophryne albipinna TaxID=1090488 RepID=A0AAD6AEY9_9TELE|nr:hypothetical protein JOQ06_004111 [Pogonophryne albipinna]
MSSGEVPRGVCSGTKLSVLMSCLVCVMCVSIWLVLNHKTHDDESLRKEFKEKKAKLRNTGVLIGQMIQKRRLKIQDFKHSLELSKEEAERELKGCVELFTALKETVESRQAELMDTMKEKQRETEEQAEGFIKELQQDISELTKRGSEVEQLSRSEDHPHLLRSFSSLNAIPHTKFFTDVHIFLPLYDVTVRTGLKKLSKEMKKMFALSILKRYQQYEVDVTLDPQTAHPKLILSDDGKQVTHGDVEKNLPDHPERFDSCPCVFAKQSFSAGRFYFKVTVSGKTKWDLGVAGASISRKGIVSLRPQKGCWMISLRNNNDYSARAGPAVSLSLRSRPQKVGVFVDYDEGLISFYDVDTADLIYSFTGFSFTEKLFPFFSPSPNHGGKNSAPLIISHID